MSACVNAVSPFTRRLVVPPPINWSLDASERLTPAATIRCVRSLACAPVDSSTSTSPQPYPAAAHTLVPPPADCQPTYGLTLDKEVVNSPVTVSGSV